MEQPTFISPSIINYGPIADTDERRAVVRRLTDALYDYLTLDVVEMERGVKMAAEQANRPQPTYYGPRPTAEMLVEASEGVEILRERVDAARAQLSNRDAQDALGPLLALMEAGIIGPMEEMLREREKYLSQLQKRMEQPEPSAE